MHRIIINTISTREGCPRAYNQNATMKEMTRKEALSVYYVVVHYLHNGGVSIANETSKPVPEWNACAIANDVSHRKRDIVDYCSVVHKDEIENYLDNCRKLDGKHYSKQALPNGY